MEQTIAIPTAEDLVYASKMLAYAGSLTQEHTDQSLTGTLEDLQKIQNLIDLDVFGEEQRLALQALGLAFGMILISQDTDFDWWIVEDSEGRNFCVRYKESALLVFPQTMFTRRNDAGQDLDVIAIFDQLDQELKQELTNIDEKDCA